jgi:hypothetical protein
LIISSLEIALMENEITFIGIRMNRLKQTIKIEVALNLQFIKSFSRG